MGVIKHKIIVVGAPAVGKTSLVKKYTKGEFKKEYIEFFAKAKTSIFTEESVVSLLFGLSDVI